MSFSRLRLAGKKQFNAELGPVIVEG